MKFHFLAIFLLVTVWSCESAATKTSAPANSNDTNPSESAQNDTDLAKKRILFFGDSITAGYGIDEKQAFPALIQQKLDSLGLPWNAVNAGLSGETSAGGLRRIDWLLREPVHMLILELGGNDGLRGVSPADTQDNLEKIIDRTRQKYPDAIIILAGMQIPPNLGQDYAQAFASVYPTVARNKNVPLIPFILEGVGGVPELNLPDGIHPTPKGHSIIAKTVWGSIQEYIYP
jgi:acyl-CoA thioesterase-1